MERVGNMHDWLPTVFLAFFVLILVLVILIDIKEFRIPNWLNFALFSIGLIFAVLVVEHPWWKSLIESIIIFSLFYAFSRVTYRIKQKTAFGMGDVKFITALTPWVGIFSIPWVVVIASVVAILWFGVLSGGQWGKLKNKRIPFGPFLAFAVLLLMGIEQVIGNSLFS